jgi:hypothetical protein
MLVLLLVFILTLKSRPGSGYVQRISYALDAEQGLLDTRVLNEPSIGGELLIHADPTCSSALTRWAAQPVYFCP